MRMINRATGTVLEIVSQEENLQELRVRSGEKVFRAYVFPHLSGEVRLGDTVLLNTTAVDLGLGSGGYHFVMAVLEPRGRFAWLPTSPSDSREAGEKGSGHIMKMRYTPCQARVLAVEEEDSPWHEQMKQAQGLDGMPVVAGSLHSMLIPCICGMKAQNPELKAAYIMTDGGALPLAFSRAVRDLKDKGLLCGTITCGHAFGGDYEAVNLYSALLAAKAVLAADVIAVMMGPGIVGTGTAWGHSGVELGQIINAVHSLGGRCLVIPRLSFADKRDRHYGISHHTLTALSKVALASSTVILPEMPKEEKNRILRALSTEDMQRHNIIWENGEAGIKLAEELSLTLSHMGRSYQEDPYFFLAASAAGKAAAKQ